MEKMTEKFAEFCEDIKFDNLPLDVVKRTKLLILDTVGIIIRARHDAESTPSLVSSIEKLEMNNGSCQVFSDKNSYTPSAAALLNGTLAHSLDFDDTHAEASLHSSAPILSAALAAAQMKKSSGQELITACVLGYEIQIRLGLAGGSSAHYKKGFHPSATCGIFGAAAAAGYLIGLNKQQFISAFGIALSQSAGSMQFLTDGAWTKRSHVGQAAQNGLNCAIMAGEGFKGPSEAFEGQWGYLHAYASGGNIEKAMHGLGEAYETLNLGVKPYPSCRYSHAAIDGLVELKNELGFSSKNLDDIDIGLSETALNIIGYPLQDKQNPKSIVDGQFSMPFCAAVAIKDGGLTWDDYKIHLENKETISLCNRIKVSPDKDAEDCCPEFMSAKVKVVVDGVKYEKFVKIPKGEPDNFMKDSEFISKFKGLTEPYLSSKRINQLTDLMLRMDSVNTVNSIFELSQVDL
ncbi:MmgE/PrpD family protein [Alphaproteobacteria bacterium]|nr:MmgE/PrpD family protein [Alphaproteobacteria bacterium]